jgi:glycosyl transferase family 25
MKIFVIHYSKFADRKTSILDQFKKQNITDFEFVEKYDKEDLQPADTQLFSGLKDSHVSLFLKHLYVYRLIAENHKHALIFEDDVILTPHFMYILAQYTKQLSPTYDMLFVGNGCNLHIQKNKWRKGQYIYRKALFPTPGEGDGASRCLDSYLMSQKCAARLCEYVKRQSKIKLAVDWWLNVASRDNQFEVYWAEPTLVTQGSQTGLFPSSLQPKVGTVDALKFRHFAAK